MNSLLSCYFPTKVIFVDDEIGVLQGLKLSLDQAVASYEIFDDAFNALELVNASNPIDFINSKISSPEARLYEVYKAMNNPKRHEEISTVVIDFQMPDINGLEFCEKIINPYVRKILYTGVADEEIAIQAFNKGLIDGYVKKQDPNKVETINKIVRTSQLKYFNTLTDVLVGTSFKRLIVENPKGTGFYDPVFIEYFNNLIKKYNICEYYLNEPVGGFICLSAEGELSTIFAYTEETLGYNSVNTYEILEEIIDLKKTEYSQLLKEIDSNKKTICVPFYGALLNINVRNWQKHVHSLEQVKGDQTYYVAYAKHPKAGKNLKLYSYEQFRRGEGRPSLSFFF